MNLLSSSRRSRWRWPARGPRGPFLIQPPRGAIVFGSLVCIAGLLTPVVAPVNASRLPAAPAVGQHALALARYRSPLRGPIVVLRRFEPPPTPYSAGHRGVDLGAPAGSLVGAAAAGRVTFAGQVAGRGVVVLAHADGIRTEYEPVLPIVTAGQVVSVGQTLGRLRGTHDRQPPNRCLHWGARRGDMYLDPLLLLRPLGPVRLLPWPDTVRGTSPPRGARGRPTHQAGARQDAAGHGP